jgi:UDP-N-acetylglucosamine 4,6-dehydratase/5-epimerase
MAKISNKNIFIIGATGSLGNKLVSRFIDPLLNNNIIGYSRDECKQWELSLKYPLNKNLELVLGDIRNFSRLETCLLRYKPNIIIIAAALKQIDRCEFAIDECVATDFEGTVNVLNCVEKNKWHELETVVFVSSDKACSPINAYGMAKALSERKLIESSFYVPTIKFVNVRYGNVLNSRGSIIPALHNQGNDLNVKEFKLTSELMTRFVMTLDQSVDLIIQAILYGNTGDTIIPELISMNVKDLFEIFSELYKKPIKITGIRPGEKMLESLINETQAMTMDKVNGYYHIRPCYLGICKPTQAMDYNSKLNPLTKEQLKVYLQKLDLI